MDFSPQISVRLLQMRVKYEEDMGSIPDAATISQCNPRHALTYSWASLKVVLRAQTLIPVCLSKNLLLANMPTNMRKD